MSGPGTCLLTGASGFIGAHLARRLVGDGYRVRCLVRPGRAAALPAGLDLEPAIGDLTEPSTLPAAVEGCQAVVHCAALVSDWATVAEIERVNVEGTRNLLAAAAGSGAVRRFLQISSTDVYGHPDRGPVGEDAVGPRPGNWYARTKLAAEVEVRRMAAAGAIEAVIVRPATVYGPGSEAVVGEIAAALRGTGMLLVGGGRADAGLCYVENLADLVLAALRSEAAAGEAFNVADGVEVSWRRFVDDLATGLGIPARHFDLPYAAAYGLAVLIEVGYRGLRRSTGLSTRALLSRQAVEVLGRPQRFATDKATRVLGWAPRVGYEEGLVATLAWLDAAR